MSGFDPLAALAADAALSQSAVAAIDLGVQIEILQQQIALGDLITATVLPPQGGSDRLSLLGQTVLAQLPPGIDPGQSLLLQVTGFQGNQILVRNLGVVDPNNPPPTVTVSLPQPQPGAPLQATLTTVVQPQLPPQQQRSQPAAQGEAQAPPAAAAANAAPANAAPANAAPPTIVPTNVAPPRAVFVAASVQPAQNLPDVENVPARAVTNLETNLEARIAATRAAAIDLSELVAPPPQKGAAPQRAGAGQTALQTTAAKNARPLQPPVVPPPIGRAGTAAAANASRSPAPIAPELALLARLRIPTLPFTLAAARLANTAAAALPRVLARLDAILAAMAGNDARAATVRALAAFVGRLDPANARALPEQLMAYVSNVVDGAEAKLAAIASALADAAAIPNAAKPAVVPSPAAQSEENAVVRQAPQSAAQRPAAVAAPPPAVAARAAERAVALQYDLKAAIASLIETPPRGAPPELAAALGEALTNVTAVQLNVLNAQNADQNAIVIPLPVFYHEGGRPAQLRISRDAPQGGGKKLDADNFHIAFVLDTKSLGTVAVDVQTASRSVSVNVKTEASTAADRFKESFGDLRGRLEQLHYRVANVSAAVAPHASAAPSASTELGGNSVDGQSHKEWLA